MPWSAAESIRHRVAILPDATRAVLALTAVGGRDLPRRALLAAGAAGDLNEAELLAGLDAACRARLLTDVGQGAYPFTHDLIRDTVLADLGSAQRAALHRRVARALAQLPARERTRRAAELALHLLHGDLPERALPHLIQAGDQAAEAHAPAEAQDHYTHAADLARELGDEAREALARERRADVSYLLGRFDDAYADLARATSIYRTLCDWERLAWATSQMAKVCDPLGRAAESMEFMVALLVTLGQAASAQQPAARADGSGAPSSLEARAEYAATLLSARTAAYVFHALAARLTFLGCYEEAIALTPAAVAHARQAGDRRIESLDDTFCAIAQVRLGRLEEARAWLDNAVSASVACGDLEAHYFALATLAAVHELRAEPRDARVALLGALDRLAPLDDVSRTCELLYMLATNAFTLGDWQEARARFTETLATAARGTPSLVFGQLADLALSSLDVIAGTRAAAALSVEESPLQDPPMIDPDTVCPALQLLSEARLLAGAALAVRDHLRVICVKASRQRLEHSALTALLAWAEADAGDDRAARATLQRARKHAAASQNRAVYATIGRVEALLALRQRRWDVAAAALDQTLALCRAMPNLYAEAKALAIYGHLHRACGKRELAREHYESALAILYRLGERLLAAQLERVLAELPTRG